MTRFVPLALAAAIVVSTAGCSILQKKESPDVLYALGANAQRVGSQTEALAFYERAATAGSARAQLVVAHHHATKRLPDNLASAVVEEEASNSTWFESALVALEREARGGNAEALVLSGLMHYAGRGTRPSKTRAAQLLKSAAALGNAEAHYWLAWMHERERNYRTAASHYESAIQGGYSRAYIGLAMLHINNRLGSDGYARGMAILRVAQDKGVDSAGSMLLGLLQRVESQAQSGSPDAQKQIEELRSTGLKELAVIGAP